MDGDVRERLDKWIRWMERNAAVHAEEAAFQVLQKSVSGLLKEADSLAFAETCLRLLGFVGHKDWRVGVSVVVILKTLLERLSLPDPGSGAVLEKVCGSVVVLAQASGGKIEGPVQAEAIGFITDSLRYPEVFNKIQSVWAVSEHVWTLLESEKIHLTTASTKLLAKMCCYYPHLVDSAAWSKRIKLTSHTSNFQLGYSIADTVFELVQTTEGRSYASNLGLVSSVIPFIFGNDKLCAYRTIETLCSLSHLGFVEIVAIWPMESEAQAVQNLVAIFQKLFSKGTNEFFNRAAMLLGELDFSLLSKSIDVSPLVAYISSLLAKQLIEKWDSSIIGWENTQSRQPNRNDSLYYQVLYGFSQCNFPFNQEVAGAVTKVAVDVLSFQSCFSTRTVRTATQLMLRFFKKYSDRTDISAQAHDVLLKTISGTQDVVIFSDLCEFITLSISSGKTSKDGLGELLMQSLITRMNEENTEIWESGIKHLTKLIITPDVGNEPCPENEDKLMSQLFNGLNSSDSHVQHASLESLCVLIEKSARLHERISDELSSILPTLYKNEEAALRRSVFVFVHTLTNYPKFNQHCMRLVNANEFREFLSKRHTDPDWEVKRNAIRFLSSTFALPNGYARDENTFFEQVKNDGEMPKDASLEETLRQLETFSMLSNTNSESEGVFVSLNGGALLLKFAFADEDRPARLEACAALSKLWDMIIQPSTITTDREILPDASTHNPKKLNLPQHKLYFDAFITFLSKQDWASICSENQPTEANDAAYLRQFEIQDDEAIHFDCE